jgi:hypothetical protein
VTTKATKPVSRQTRAMFRSQGLRPVIVTVYPEGIIGLRLYRLRREEQLDAATLYERAVKTRVAREHAERRAARKARK